MDGWMDGWMGGWVDGKAGLRIAYSNQKYDFYNYFHIIPTSLLKQHLPKIGIKADEPQKS